VLALGRPFEQPFHGVQKIARGRRRRCLSAKIYMVEIWARDEFVRKSSFETVVSRLEKGLGDLGDKIEGRFDRITERLEKIAHN
jgi:hypothetical protein